jgi:protein-S-isoprenylcysteine O-methyltransferase Ste14
MALTDEFREQGEWLFRWRSYLPLVLVPLIAVALAQMETHPVTAYDRAWDYFCLGLSFLGMFVRVMTIGFVPRQTSGRNTTELVAAELNSTGMYSIVRHPLYLGNYLMGLGIAMVQFVWWLPVIYSLTFWLYYERIMFVEEAFLRHRFREKYRRWAAVTPAFWPRIGQWRKPALSFSWRHIFRREYSGMMVIILCHAGQKCAKLLLIEHRIVWEVFWATLLFGGLTSYFILMWISRKTTLLNVPGRL